MHEISLCLFVRPESGDCLIKEKEMHISVTFMTQFLKTVSFGAEHLSFKLLVWPVGSGAKTSFPWRKVFIAFLHSSLMCHPVLITCHYGSILAFAYLQQHLESQPHPGFCCCCCCFPLNPPVLANNKDQLAALCEGALKADVQNSISKNVKSL